MPLHTFPTSPLGRHSVMKAGGLEMRKYSIAPMQGRRRDPAVGQNDPGMKKFFAFLEKYYPEQQARWLVVTARCSQTMGCAGDVRHNLTAINVMNRRRA